LGGLSVSIGMIGNLSVQAVLSFAIPIEIVKRNKPVRMYHYTSKKGFIAILMSGQVGLWFHQNFWTQTEFSNRFAVQNFLAIPNTPDIRIELTIYPVRDLMFPRQGRTVLEQPDWGKPTFVAGLTGGGREWFTYIPVPYYSRQPVVVTLF
jgi:hypothetical protein